MPPALLRLLFVFVALLAAIQPAGAAETLTFAFDRLENPANFDGGTPDPAAHYVDGRPFNYYDGRALRRGQVSATIFVVRPGARLDTKPRTWTVRRERVGAHDVVLLAASDFKIELHGAVAPPADVRQLLRRAFGRKVRFGAR